MPMSPSHEERCIRRTLPRPSNLQHLPHLPHLPHQRSLKPPFHLQCNFSEATVPILLAVFSGDVLAREQPIHRQSHSARPFEDPHRSCNQRHEQLYARNLSQRLLLRVQCAPLCVHPQIRSHLLSAAHQR